MNNSNAFNTRSTIKTAAGDVTIYRLDALAKAGVGHVDRLPRSIKVLLESALRSVDGFAVTEHHVKTIAAWTPDTAGSVEIPFLPARVLLQDFTGVPAMVDLAAMRDAMKKLGGDPNKINPLIPADLVIDHSVQVDAFGNSDALEINAKIEFERNRERYEFLHWGQHAFDNFRVVPPATGIVHQVNLEYLASVVARRTIDGVTVAMPDSLVGTDSHTTMINGLGVAGWGVGGIEAEAVMLGQPIYMLMPEVVGFELTGRLAEGSTATDLVLVITEILRTKGVVGKFVEFYGDGLSSLSLADRATIANMAPEYGATMGFFPVDDETLAYLRRTARPDEGIDLVERYCKEQGLFRKDGESPATYCDAVQLELSEVEPSLAGPKRPQDRVPLSAMKDQWEQDLSAVFGKSAATGTSTPNSWQNEGGHIVGQQATEAAAAVADEDLGLQGIDVEYEGNRFKLKHGSVVIAAITSCTNTSNPSVMLAAGLVARKARERGLMRKPWVKTSLAPGSRVVTEYLNASKLDKDLDALGFYTVGYGCTTCIGNSGPLPEPIASAVTDHDLVVASVLSGNRNFEGRVHPLVRANYLASPPLVVAYALAGTTDIDLTHEPIGSGKDGKDVFLKDIWPSQKEIRETIDQFVKPSQFREKYANVFDESEQWNRISSQPSDTYPWDDSSTYIQNPPFFETLTKEPPPIEPVFGARVLVMVGDSITTDHISPAGAIKKDSPAGRYLIEHGVEPKHFNSYGSRRGNDRVMTRGTFANVRVRNQLAPGTEGGYTVNFMDPPKDAERFAEDDPRRYGTVSSIFDAAMDYKKKTIPLVVLAGKDYGMGSSRDWAAKGALLLGIKAVIAESYERIHRSNLVGMGVLPLQFPKGENRESLGLTGREVFDIEGLGDDLKAGGTITTKITDPVTNKSRKIEFVNRIDAAVEVEYYRNGGILQTVLRKLAK